MNFSPKGTKHKQDEINSSATRVKSKIFIIAFRVFMVILISVSVIGVFTISGFVKGIIDTSPTLNKMDVVPQKFPTKIYASNGDLVQELKGAETNREYVTLDKIPDSVQNAFVAIEDERFFEHNGIDIKGIFRASITGLSSGFSQGASTLTQQLLKNTKFNHGMESTFYKKLERKVQEQYLAIKLENKLTKKEILEYYLNTINLGAGTYGVQTASKEYFDKTVSELTVSEAAVIASITQQPTALNPIENPDKNKKRMLQVLKKMYEQKYITKKEYKEAKKDKVYDRIESVDLKKEKNDETTVNSYFVDALYRQVQEDLVEKAGYNKEEATSMLNSGGLQIHSTLDSNMQSICDDVINNPSNYDVRESYQLVYALSVTNKKGEIKNYNEEHLKNYFKKDKDNSNFDLRFDKKDDADKYIKEYKEHILDSGAEFIADKVSFTLQPQISFTLIDQSTGEVKAICGGRGEKTSSLSLNRATDSERQPGSTFKILAAFLPALDTSGMTLATVKDDAPYNNIDSWRGYHKGLTTIREGIWDSNNVVAAKTYDDVTSSVALNYINNLGITSLTPEDVGASVALGGLTNGVKNLELTAAYAAIANNGTYIKPHFYTKVVDSTGNVILEYKEESKQVMKETTAWLLTDAMHDVVTGSGTGTAANFSGMYVAGKTGTSSSNRDLWFAGFTPYYTASIWTGFDTYDKKVGGSSSSYHKRIWSKIMSAIHRDLDNKSFTKPNGITSSSICTKCGKKAIADVCSHAHGGSSGQYVKTEYFASGTAPGSFCTCHQKIKVCEVTGHAASEYCPTKEVVYLIKDSASSSRDSNLIAPSKTSTICTECDGSSVIDEIFNNEETTETDENSESTSTEEDDSTTEEPIPTPEPITEQ